jgi:hypothetical protein
MTAAIAGLAGERLVECQCGGHLGEKGKRLLERGLNLYEGMMRESPATTPRTGGAVPPA